MTKKVTEIIIIVVGIVFLCWYLPVAFYNVYACDDYWFGTNVRINGFWGNQLFYYFNWEGSYTHTFLASLPHAFHGSHIPFWVNLFSLGLLFVSIYAFLRTYTSLSVKKGVACSLYFLSFLYLCTKGDSEIRFWVCANITYISEMSFLLFFGALYHNFYKDSSYNKWLLVILFTFLIGGSKLTFVLYAISGIVIHNILYERSFNRNTLMVFFLITVFVIINVAAPGNYIRLEEETIPKEMDEHMTILESIFYRITEMKSFIINTLFLLPISAQWSNRQNFKKNSVYIAIIVFIVTFILDGLIMYICFNNSGPLRVYFIAEVCIAFLIFFLLNHFYTSVLVKYIYTGSIILLFAFLVVASHMSMAFLVPDSIEFSEKARERDRYVMSCADGETIEIAPLPSSCLMLSYFSNDVIWLERIYLPYFQKSNKFILLEPCNNTEK